MTLNFDGRGLPACCGIGLIPGEPQTVCPRCHARYDTDLLAQKFVMMRQGENAAAISGFGHSQLPGRQLR